MLKLSEGSLPRDPSVERTLSHGAILGADTVESEQLCLQEWRGFLVESATKYLLRDLSGAITIRITFLSPMPLCQRKTVWLLVTT